MVEVFARKGPLAGRRIEIPEDKVEAATGESGWATKLEPGAQLVADPGAPYDVNWEIPGYTRSDLEPFAEKGPQGQTADIKQGAARTTDARVATDAAKSSTSSAGSTSTRTAPSAAKEPAEEPSNGDKTKPSSK